VPGKSFVRPASIPPRRPILASIKTKSPAGGNKCVLCGKKCRVYPVELQVPSFSKGIVKRDVTVCTNCLEFINEAYIRHKREKLDEDGCIYEHEHVHEH